MHKALISAPIALATVFAVAAPASAAAAPQPWSRSAVTSGFNGDDVTAVANWRTATNNGGSVRVVSLRVRPVVSANGLPDLAVGMADAHVKIVRTNGGAVIRDLGVVGISGRAGGTLFDLGDLVTNTSTKGGVTLSVDLDVRYVQRHTDIPLVHS